MIVVGLVGNPKSSPVLHPCHGCPPCSKWPIKMCLCDHESPVGNPLHNSKFKFRACPYRPRRSSLLEWMITFCLMKKSPPVRNKAIHIHSTVVFHCCIDDPQWRWLVRCSPLESRLTLTSAMRERGSLRCSHCNGHKDIEKIEAECEVSVQSD